MTAIDYCSADSWRRQPDGKAAAAETRLSISPSLLDRLKEWALASSPYECCGVLAGYVDGDQRVIRRVHPAANVWAGDRRRRYQIDPRAVFEAFRDARNEGLQVLGFYHSHPDGTATPSTRDIEAAWAGKSYVIITINEGRVASVRSWRLESEESGMFEEPVD